MSCVRENKILFSFIYQQEQQQEETLQKTSERPIGDGVQSKLLRDKLTELENEIERFRKENTMLAKLRDEREKVYIFSYF